MIKLRARTDLTETQKEFIRDNWQDMELAEIADILHVPVKSVVKYFDADVKPKTSKSYKKSTLCWKCGKADASGDCPWANHLHPVEGWTAIKYKGKFTSYTVIKCPLYVKLPESKPLVSLQSNCKSSEVEVTLPPHFDSLCKKFFTHG